MKNSFRNRFGFGKGRRKGKCSAPLRKFRNNKKCWKDFDNAYELSNVLEGVEVIVICNHDLKLIEMGLYVGSRLKIMRNHWSLILRMKMQ